MGPKFRSEIRDIICFMNKKHQSSKCLQNKDKQKIVNSLNQIRSTKNQPTIFIPSSTVVQAACEMNIIQMDTFGSTKIAEKNVNTAVLYRCQSLANKNETNRIKLKRFSSVIECSTSFIENKKTTTNSAVKFNV